jgi:hypothetical protein
MMESTLKLRRCEYTRNARKAPAGSASRCLCMFETDEVTKAWPFHELRHPYFEDEPFGALTGEGPMVFDASQVGQVYRSGAIKYTWSLDAYLAFVWRFNPENETRRIDLATSRDGGVLWRIFAPQRWCIEPGAMRRCCRSMAVSGVATRFGSIILQRQRHSSIVWPNEP